MLIRKHNLTQDVRLMFDLLDQFKEEIRKLDSCSEKFYDILGEWILYGKLGESDYPECKHLVLQIENYLTQHNDAYTKEAIHQYYYEAYCNENWDLPLPNRPQYFPMSGMLVWAYGTKLSGQNLLSDINLKLMDYDAPVDSLKALKAFWSVLKLSKIQSLHVTQYLEQSAERLKVTNEGISNCPLTHLSFYRNYLLARVTPDQWKMLWQAIQRSGLESLDLDSNDLSANEDYHQFWEIMCEGIQGSHLKKMNLRYNGLRNLHSIDWKMFYYTIKSVKLESLNLSYNFFYKSMSANLEEITDECKWICEVIKSSGIKELEIYGEKFERMSAPFFAYFCQSLAESNLEKLEIAVSVDNALAENSWLLFIEALRKTKIKSLTIHYCCGEEFSNNVIKAFCHMLNDSLLESITLKNNVNHLSLSVDEWKLLGRALNKRKIEIFNFGIILLSEQTMESFRQGILASGVKRINLPKNSFDQWTINLWNEFSKIIKEAEIHTLDLRSTYIGNKKSTNSSGFYNMISMSQIKSLYASFNYFELSLENCSQLCSSIVNSKLEFLDLDFGNYERWFRSEYQNGKNKWEEFSNAIKASRLTFLNLNPEMCEEAFFKAELTGLMNIINNRKKYDNTLFGTCALTLFNQYNGKISSNTLSYENEQNQWEVDLLVGEKEMITNAWFKRS